MREIKIGVEIEFYGVHYEKVLKHLQAKGISVSYEGYTHQVMAGWKLVTDVSVTSIGTGVRKGLELVSPILYGDEGLDELEVVMNTLESIGAKVDKSCGLHVHHDVNDYTLKNFKSLYNMYWNYQNGIDSILPKSRRTVYENRYCKGLKTYRMNAVQRASSIDRLVYVLETRYIVLNPYSYIKYGTIEFRQHSGTVEFSKIEAWIVLTHCMVNYCRNNFVEYDENSELGLDELLNKLNLNDSYVGDFLCARKLRLA